MIKSMGTAFSLAILGASPTATEELIAAIKEDFARIESWLSVLRPDSEIYQWQHGHLRDAQLSMEIREVMADCNLAEELTGGLFSAQHADKYDPTCYVKGWTLSRASRRLDDAGIDSYYLNGAGNVIARGNGPDGKPWRLGVTHPYHPGELAAMITAPAGDGRPLAIATSCAGECGSHGCADDWLPGNSTVTVVGHQIALVNMASIAALAAGRQGSDGSSQLVRHLGLEAFGFDDDQHPWWTEGMRHYALAPQTAKVAVH